jgi:hypothetical protein
MKKSKKVIKWINTGIFPMDVMLSVGFSYDEIVKHLKTIKADGWLRAIAEDRNLFTEGSGFALKRTVTDAKNGKSVRYFYLILPSQFDFTDYAYCILAHEILHICQFMLPDMLDRNLEHEAEAYLHTHLMQQALKELRK